MSFACWIISDDTKIVSYVAKRIHLMIKIDDVIIKIESIIRKSSGFLTEKLFVRVERL